MARKESGGSLAHKADAESEDNTLEGHLLRCLDASHNLASRLLAASVAVNLLHVDGVQVGNVMYQSLAVIVVNGLRSQRVVPASQCSWRDG